MSGDKQVRIFRARSGPDDSVVIAVELSYLRSQPVVCVSLTDDEAVMHAEELLRALRLVRQRRADRATRAAAAPGGEG